MLAPAVGHPDSFGRVETLTDVKAAGQGLIFLARANVGREVLNSGASNKPILPSHEFLDISDISLYLLFALFRSRTGGN